MEGPKVAEKPGVGGFGVKLEEARIAKSAYFQMRAIGKDLKPRFLEVLKDPDYKNSKSAQEIRLKLDQLMSLYVQVVGEIVDVTEKTKAPESHPTTTQVQDSCCIPSTRIHGKSQADELRIPGTYVVGGSAFGWNFITFPGNQAVYYGKTKEAFRATQSNIFLQKSVGLIHI